MLHLQERPEYDGPVLLKEPAHEELTSAQIAQLHNEHVITRQLAHVPGVRAVYTKEGSESHPVLFLEYIQGQSLSEIIQGQSLDLLQKLQLAVEIVEILSRIHEQRVMHKDICSSNILIADTDKPGSQDGVYIIDFGIASTVRQESAYRLAPNDTLGGTLAYISPDRVENLLLV